MFVNSENFIKIIVNKKLKQKEAWFIPKFAREFVWLKIPFL